MKFKILMLLLVAGNFLVNNSFAQTCAGVAKTYCGCDYYRGENTDSGSATYIGYVKLFTIDNNGSSNNSGTVVKADASSTPKEAIDKCMVLMNQAPACK